MFLRGQRMNYRDYFTSFGFKRICIQNFRGFILSGELLERLYKTIQRFKLVYLSQIHVRIIFKNVSFISLIRCMFGIIIIKIIIGDKALICIIVMDKIYQKKKLMFTMCIYLTWAFAFHIDVVLTLTGVYSSCFLFVN